MPYLEPRGTSMERRWGRKKKKKMFFSKNPTISEGEGGKLGALGEVIQAKKKKAVCRFASRFRGGPVGLQMLKLYYDSNRR